MLSYNRRIGDNMKRSKGFSLAEMMAVIAVLGILAVLLLPNVLNAYRDAKKGVLLDEAKSVYAEARNKYATEKASGKVVSVLTDAESTDENTYELDLSNNNIEYFVRLDAHGEVRLPINYYIQNNKATFILVNDSMLWMYTLRNVD